MKQQSKDLDLLIDEATVDSYDEYECRVGFLTMIQDNLQTPFTAGLDKHLVTVREIDGNDRVIKAIVNDGEKTYPVDILDLNIDDQVKGFEWVAAYRKWEKGGEI